MTDTKFEGEPMMGRRSTDRPYERRGGARRRPPRRHALPPAARPAEAKIVTARETRRSLLTTEFWLTLAAATGLIIAGYWDEAELSLDLAYALAAGIVAAYILSRGFAKAGSGEPVIRNLR